MKCPKCRESNNITRVMTYGQKIGVCTCNFCLECLTEFNDKGKEIPSLYKKSKQEIFNELRDEGERRDKVLIEKSGISPSSLNTYLRLYEKRRNK